MIDRRSYRLRLYRWPELSGRRPQDVRTGDTEIVAAVRSSILVALCDRASRRASAQTANRDDGGAGAVLRRAIDRVLRR